MPVSTDILQDMRYRNKPGEICTQGLLILEIFKLVPYRNFDMEDYKLVSYRDLHIKQQ
jgi:hypothetical protein